MCKQINNLVNSFSHCLEYASEAFMNSKDGYDLTGIDFDTLYEAKSKAFEACENVFRQELEATCRSGETVDAPVREAGGA